MELLDKIIAPKKDAPITIIFGGSPLRRHDVLTLFQEIGGVTAYAALSEEEGMKMLGSHQADIVLIGGRYTTKQRSRIKNYVSHSLPNAKITEPGVDYHYSNENIKQAIISFLKKE